MQMVSPNTAKLIIPRYVRRTQQKKTPTALCKNNQNQSCFITIFLTNGPLKGNWIAFEDGLNSVKLTFRQRRCKGIDIFFKLTEFSGANNG